MKDAALNAEWLFSPQFFTFCRGKGHQRTTTKEEELTLLMCFLCPRHQAKCSQCRVSHKPHNSLSPFYGWGGWGWVWMINLKCPAGIQSAQAGGPQSLQSQSEYPSWYTRHGGPGTVSTCRGQHDTWHWGCLGITVLSPGRAQWGNWVWLLWSRIPLEVNILLPSCFFIKGF